MDLEVRVALVATVAFVAGCATDRPASDAARHRCIDIPNGLVECSVVTEEEAGDVAR